MDVWENLPLSQPGCPYSCVNTKLLEYYGWSAALAGVLPGHCVDARLAIGLR